VEGERIFLQTEPGLEIVGTLWKPPSTGPHPALLIVDTGATPREMASRIAAAGHIVLVLTPRGLPAKPDPRIYMGDWLANTRAWLIGKNLPALRARDIIRGIDYLAALPDVKPSEIKASASDVSGIWLLMAAALDRRISRVWLDKTPYSFESAFNGPVHRNLHDAALPGFALHWDIAALARLVAPRIAAWTDPADWLRNVTPVPGSFIRYRIYDKPEEDLPGLMQQ
jgi:cephalosporin-C deacetylase-like acetyl esterase